MIRISSGPFHQSTLLKKSVFVTFRHSIAMLTSAAILLAGCTAPQDRDRTAALSLSEGFAGQQDIIGPHQEPPYQWWTLYESEELDSLVKTALKNNTSLLQTKKRLEQAAAIARTTLADLAPDITATLGGDTQRGDNKSPSSFSLAGAARYELDIWGKNRAGYMADKREAQAVFEDLQSAAITISASIVENWIRLAALREEETLLREQIKTNQTILDLQHKRYEGGAVQAPDVLQQTERLSRAKTLLPDILAAQDLTLQQIAVLAGQNPSTPPALNVKSLPKILPLPDTGIPAQLLERRPDINAAWRRLQAADWNSAAAKANRLPSLDLSASYLSTDTAISGLLDTWLLTLASSLTTPLIDGGARRAEVTRSAALADERFIAYKETVLNAIADTESALTRNKHQEETIKAIEKQLQTVRASLERAQSSYISGDGSYLTVLDNILDIQSLEQQLIQERRDLTLYRVALYRALGLGTRPEEDHKET